MDGDSLQTHGKSMNDLNRDSIKQLLLPNKQMENISLRRKESQSERELEMNAHQIGLADQMVEMGFSLMEVLILIDMCKANSIEAALNYLEMHPNMITHAFRGKKELEEVCDICGKVENEHRYVESSQYIKSQSILSDEENMIQIGSIEYLNSSGNKLFNQLGAELEQVRISSHIKFESCMICYQDYEESQMIHIEGISHMICSTCFQTFLRESILIGRVLDIQCPHCKLKLSFKFIQGILDTQTFAKYRQYLLDQLVTIDPYMRWCPNVKCGQPVKLAKNFKRKEKCPKCEAPLCTECNREYHKRSCATYFEREIKQWETHEDIQRCKVCKTVVSKISGCNHMTWY